MIKRIQPPDSSRLLFGPENSAIWLVAIIGLSLSFAALLLMQRQLEAHKMLDFDWVAHNRIRALSYGIDNSMLAVTTLRDHVLASGGVDGEGFRLFAESLLDRYQGVKALIWVPQVRGSEREAFEASTTRSRDEYQLSEHGNNFELISRGEHAEHFPVLHTVPKRDNGIRAGLDLGSIPKFAEVLSRAREQGRMAASGRITYPTSQGGSAYGFMVASPVFGMNGPVESADQHSPDLAGYVVGLFRFGSLVDSAISLLEPRGVEILMLDESAPIDERFLGKPMAKPMGSDSNELTCWEQYSIESVPNASKLSIKFMIMLN